VFEDLAANLPPEFWQTIIGDPGPAVEELFDISVYFRGAMTLQALRQTVGDEVFFDILEEWTESNTGGNVSTADFIKLAERLSGQDLAGFFTMWLYTPSRPGTLSSLDRQAFGQQRGAPGTARMLEERLESGIKPR
jgi:aminopeptidase N